MFSAYKTEFGCLEDYTNSSITEGPEQTPAGCQEMNIDNMGAVAKWR